MTAIKNSDSKARTRASKRKTRQEIESEILGAFNSAAQKLSDPMAVNEAIALCSEQKEDVFRLTEHPELAEDFGASARGRMRKAREALQLLHKEIVAFTEDLSSCLKDMKAINNQSIIQGRKYKKIYRKFIDDIKRDWWRGGMEGILSGADVYLHKGNPIEYLRYTENLCLKFIDSINSILAKPENGTDSDNLDLLGDLEILCEEMGHLISKWWKSLAEPWYLVAGLCLYLTRSDGFRRWQNAYLHYRYEKSKNLRPIPRNDKPGPFIITPLRTPWS